MQRKRHSCDQHSRLPVFGGRFSAGPGGCSRRLFFSPVLHADLAGDRPGFLVASRLRPLALGASRFSAGGPVRFHLGALQLVIAGRLPADPDLAGPVALICRVPACRPDRRRPAAGRGLHRAVRPPAPAAAPHRRGDAVGHAAAGTRRPGGRPRARLHRDPAADVVQPLLRRPAPASRKHQGWEAVGPVRPPGADAALGESPRRLHPRGDRDRHRGGRSAPLAPRRAPADSAGRDRGDCTDRMQSCRVRDAACLSQAASLGFRGVPDGRLRGVAAVQLPEDHGVAGDDARAGSVASPAAAHPAAAAAFPARGAVGPVPDLPAGSRHGNQGAALPGVHGPRRLPGHRAQSHGDPRAPCPDALRAVPSAGAAAGSRCSDGAGASRAGSGVRPRGGALFPVEAGGGLPPQHGGRRGLSGRQRRHGKRLQRIRRGRLSGVAARPRDEDFHLRQAGVPGTPHALQRDDLPAIEVGVACQLGGCVFVLPEGPRPVRHRHRGHPGGGQPERRHHSPGRETRPGRRLGTDGRPAAGHWSSCERPRPPRPLSGKRCRKALSTTP